MPANWTIIHKLANCTGEEISRAIRAQVLHPDCARRELDAWLKGNSEARKDDARRKASNDARHDDLLRQLTDALKPSPEFRAIWKRCRDAVRARFARSLTKSIY